MPDALICFPGSIEKSKLLGATYLLTYLLTYLMQQSLPKIGQQECVGQYMFFLLQNLSQTRPPTIIINQKRF
jgi:hypothetical protein